MLKVTIDIVAHAERERQAPKTSNCDRKQQ